jgi:hypothetical protein
MMRVLVAKAAGQKGRVRRHLESYGRSVPCGPHLADMTPDELSKLVSDRNRDACRRRRARILLKNMDV